MCVITHNKKASRKLTKEEFEAAWNRNSHGFGLMYSNGKQITVLKSMELEKSFEIYKQAMDTAKDGVVVSHFRMATHWPRTIANCHPFYCGKDEYGGDMYLVHNWILWFTSKEHPEWSDTRIFANLLSNLPNAYHKMDEYINHINKQCSWDKILIMDSRWNVFYFWKTGVDIVEGENGIWASNDSPTPRRSFTSYFKRGDSHHEKKKDFSTSTGGGTIPALWTFVWVPSPQDEKENAGSIFCNWILHCNGYFINKMGYVQYYPNK